MGRKFQERQQREAALDLFREAAKLDPDGKILMKSDAGVQVSCRDMAEFQLARTYVATFGTIEPNRILSFIRTRPASPLLREAYLEVGRFLDLSDEEDRDYFREMLIRFPRDPEVLERLARMSQRVRSVRELHGEIEEAVSYGAETVRAIQDTSPGAAAKILADLNLQIENLSGAEKAYGPEFIAGQTKAWARTLIDYADYWMSRKKDSSDARLAARLALHLQPSDASIQQGAAKVFLSDPPLMEEALAAYGPSRMAALSGNQQNLFNYFSFWMGRKANRESALAALDLLLQNEPENLNFRMSAAGVLWRNGETEKAIAVFGPAYAASHSDRLAHLYEYGNFWVGKNANLDTAVPALVKACTEAALPMTSKWRAAELLAKSGKIQEVDKFFGPTTLTQTLDDDLGLSVYLQFWQDRGKDAEYILPALELMEKLPRLEWMDRVAIAQTYAKMKFYDRAEKIYGPEYLKTIAADGQKLIYYAQFWAPQNKNLFSAMEAARAAARIVPEKAAAWGVLADLLQLDGKKDEAKTAIAKAVNLAKSKSEKERFEKRKAEIYGEMKK